MYRAIFLDRDGVINQAEIVDGVPRSPRKFDEFKILSGVKEAIAGFKKKGFKIIVVTNQPEVSRGLLEKEELDKMHAHLKTKLDVDDIFICLHDDHHNCNCRKPKPGMLMEAAKRWNIDLSESYMVGDRWKDIEAGKDAGCKTVLISNPASGNCQPDFRIESITEIISIYQNHKEQL